MSERLLVIDLAIVRKAMEDGYDLSYTDLKDYIIAAHKMVTGKEPTQEELEGSHHKI